MAKNKKKLRKKLRHELLQKAQQQSVVQSTPELEHTTEMSKAVTPSAQPVNSGLSTQKNYHQAIVVNPHIKKDIILALSFSTLIIVAIIAGRILNNEYGWVIQTADWLYGLF